MSNVEAQDAGTPTGVWVMGLFEEREIGDEYNAQLCGTTRRLRVELTIEQGDRQLELRRRGLLAAVGPRIPKEVSCFRGACRCGNGVVYYKEILSRIMYIFRLSFLVGEVDRVGSWRYRLCRRRWNVKQ
ncbi:hypothetical protein BU26DRAFT_525858 [Trematosphaeria pertusa]|uniref:Uncharacterized protein n=1 Tax=Trematosphaeria pertusa TaxID=390896 RepID=A0A6A6HSY1_9PLEO|nr:uncharacterized protein BU26DRAFT_525858 [Trematosphaeria pertusa]KAF2240633.1 hypothetical protein BU26DRAFT_525858 [Trematosphaeria pertusa]